DSRELLRRGAAVALSPKAFQLLLTLLEQRPKALSRGGLYGPPWADTGGGAAHPVEPGGRAPRRPARRPAPAALHPHRAPLRLRVPHRHAGHHAHAAAPAPRRLAPPVVARRADHPWRRRSQM